MYIVFIYFFDFQFDGDGRKAGKGQKHNKQERPCDQQNVLELKKSLIKKWSDQKLI